MTQPIQLLLPLLSAILYVFGALMFKRASSLGVGVWRSAFVFNMMSAVVFAPLLFLGGSFYWDRLWQPALVGLLYLAGQLLALTSLNYGDVSVATPVLSLKIILVAFFTTLLLHISIAPKLWLAAALSVAAIALLNAGKQSHPQRLGTTLLSAGASATSFALFDVLVQKWSPSWGMGRFLPVMIGFVALYSFGFIARFQAPLCAIPGPARPWLLGGTFFMSLQSCLFVIAIARFGNATVANVIYSTRGLWSVLGVWLLGHWFKSREQQLGFGVLRWRLAGALLMTGAILLVLR